MMGRLYPQILQRARDLRHRETRAERILWKALRNRKVKNWKFRRQHPVSIGYVLDFYCAETKVSIELDGEIHQSAEQQMSDQNRTSVLAEYGINEIRFSNEDVIQNVEGIIRKIIDFSILTADPRPNG